jgi:hypothetical protein
MLENGVQVCYVFANKTVAVQELNTPTYLGVVPVDIKRLVYHAYLALGPHWIVAYVLHGAVPVGREIEKSAARALGTGGILVRRVLQGSRFSRLGPWGDVH